MRTLDRSTLSIGAAAALLAGCGGSQLPIGASGAVPQSQGASAPGGRSGSWMLPEARSEDLLYVTNALDNVNVYSYPNGKLVGILQGFNSTVGLCVDSGGNVFATNQIPARIYEYAHGATKRIATLKVGIHRGKTDLLPVGCSIDPTNGDLAVTGFSNHINIFKGARGRPLLYTDKGFYFFQFCGYDPSGDLFIAGWKDSKGKSGFAELPKGSNKVANITLNVPIYPDGGVQWDGRHIAVFAFDPPKNGKPAIYQFAINGTRGTKVGTTPLGSPASLVFQFYISGKTLIAPNWYGGSDQYSNVLFFNYPAGGNPYMTLTKKIYKPRGSVISFAPH